MKINKYLNKITKTDILIICLGLVFLIGLLDYITGTEISLSILYLIPIVVIAWKAGRKRAILLAFLCACVWAFTNGISNTEVQVFNSTHLWNTLVRFGFFITIALLMDKVINYKTGLEEKIHQRTAELWMEIESRIKTEKELKSKSDKLSLLAKRMQIIREEENTKIAREIHDELGQALTAIKIEILTLSKKYANNKFIVDRLFIVTDIVDGIIKAVRKISTRLRPRLLDELGLLPAIEGHLKDVQNRTGIDCNITGSDENLKLNQDVSNNIFRIYQEAITNIIRHSRATKVSVKIFSNYKEKLIMEINDNGIGLPEGYMDKTNSLGILGMKERALTLKGTVDVLPGKYVGTKVIIMIPLNHKGK